jgi:hypothetical protein
VFPAPSQASFEKVQTRLVEWPYNVRNQTGMKDFFPLSSVPSLSYPLWNLCRLVDQEIELLLIAD